MIHTLSEPHRSTLRSAAIDPEFSASLGDYTARSITDLPKEFRTQSWAPRAAHYPALVFAWPQLDGSTLYQVRPDSPPLDDAGKPKKYLFPAGSTGAYAPSALLRAGSPDGPVLVQEGTKQARAAATHAPAEYEVLAVAGCRAIQSLPDEWFARFVRRVVVISFDGDWETNPDVMNALHKTVQRFKEAGADRVKVLSLKGRMSAPTDGLDDVLAVQPEDKRAQCLAYLLDNARKAPDGRTTLGTASQAREWLTSTLGTARLSGVFSRAGQLVCTPRIGERGYITPPKGSADPLVAGAAQVLPLAADSLRGLVNHRYADALGRYEVIKDDAGVMTGRRWIPASLQTDPVSNVVGAVKAGESMPKVRTLSRVVHTPVVLKDGSVLAEPGYHADSQVLYLPARDLDVPAVSDAPSDADIKAARELLLDPIAQFPFVTDDHRLNWIGLLFTPLLGDLVPGPRPLGIIDATQKGTGKSYLASMIRAVHGGAMHGSLTSDKEEQNKIIMSILTTTTAPVVCFDNQRGTVRGAPLEALLTSTEYQGRELGKTGIVRAVNDRLWLMTGNNAAIGGDLARRVIWVSLDANVPNPHERTGFRIADPVAWMTEHRGAVLHAMLTIARGWVLAGRPMAAARRSDDFAAWQQQLGGMLAWAGFEGSLTGSAKSVESEDDSEWGDFLVQIFEVFGTKPWQTSDVMDKIKESSGSFEDRSKVIDPSCLPGALAEGLHRSGTAGTKRSLGKWIGNRVGQYANGYAVKLHTSSHRGNTYRLEEAVPVVPEDAPASNEEIADPFAD